MTPYKFFRASKILEKMYSIDLPHVNGWRECECIVMESNTLYIQVTHGRKIMIIVLNINVFKVCNFVYNDFYSIQPICV
jgi:hypothetical protein